MKFNLDNDEDGESDTNVDFLTHRGKKLEELDDFKEKIDNSDDDVYEDQDLQKGRMNEEMVNSLNFGGHDNGEEDPSTKKKTREERHAEIMEKSKAYKYHA